MSGGEGGVGDPAQGRGPRSAGIVAEEHFLARTTRLAPSAKKQEPDSKPSPKQKIRTVTVHKHLAPMEGGLDDWRGG